MSDTEHKKSTPIDFVTAFFNLENGFFNIVSCGENNALREKISSGSVPSGISGYLKLFSVNDRDLPALSDSLSAESLSRELSDKDCFCLRFCSEMTENSFDWFELKASVCERSEGAPRSVLLHTKNMNLIMPAKADEKPGADKAQKMLDDCLKGFGTVFQNIILVNVNENSYLFRNPYGSSGTAPAVVPDGTYTYDNYAYGMSFVHPDDRELFWSYTTLDAYRTRLKQDGDHNSFRLRHLMDGEYRWVRVYTIRLGDKEDFRVLYFINDIQEYTEKEIKSRLLIEDALKQARAAERVQTEFISSMSHDIRTPLNAIAGMTMLARKNIGDRERLTEYLNKIDTSCKLLSEIINEVLDISLLKSGKTILDIKPFRLEDLAKDLEEMMKPQAEKKGIDFSISLEKTRRRHLKGDSIQLFKILQNMLSNSIKYTGSGGKVSLDIEERENSITDKIVYRFICRDNGIGMSEEFLKTAFTPFERENDELVNRTQGTGLGLTIIKNLVDTMGGKLKLESEKGKGTVFTVALGFLPLNEEEEAKSAEAHDKELSMLSSEGCFRGCRVLLVEDNEINKEISEEILLNYGAEVDSAADGQEAVDKFIDGGDWKYDFILMDIRMPRKNGYEATEEIRREPGKYAANIPIIAMTAEAFNEEVRKAYECGMNAYISKPINVENLIRTVLSVL
ncbi:MAG: hybrid sensor histidine kinase/response regulator [Ruminiclostridium sp.]